MTAAWGRGGKVTLKANGAKIAEGRLERSVPIQFAIFEGLDVGMDICSAVDFTYALPFTFTGTVERVVEIEVFPEGTAKQKAPKAKSQEPVRPAGEFRGARSASSRSVPQELVHEGDGHAALPDRRRHALHGAQPHVAAGEDAGDAGLQQVGIA